MRLQEQTILVTGAGSGVGRAVAHHFAAEGATVIAIGRTEAKLQETVAFAKGPGRIVPRVADVADRQQVAVLIRGVLESFGKVDVLVNNAGVNTPHRSLDKLTLDTWDYLISVNLTGAFVMIHALLPHMRERRQGLIINISSVAGIRPSPLGGAAYCASKFGLNGLSGVVALEEAKHGIRSTVICPGEINTPILDDRPVPVTPEQRALDLQPEDVADAVLFVAKLPPRAHVPEIIIKPTTHAYA